MNTDYSQEIIDSVNRFLDAQCKPTVSLNEIVFAMDADVNYGALWSVPLSKVIQPSKFRGIVTPLISKGPSWIHANLIPTSDHRSLVTISIGNIVGNPSPQINVSIEVNKIVEIVE